MTPDQLAEYMKKYKANSGVLDSLAGYASNAVFGEKLDFLAERVDHQTTVLERMLNVREGIAFNKQAADYLAGAIAAELVGAGHGGGNGGGNGGHHREAARLSVARNTGGPF